MTSHYGIGKLSKKTVVVQSRYEHWICLVDMKKTMKEPQPGKPVSGQDSNRASLLNASLERYVSAQWGYLRTGCWGYLHSLRRNYLNQWLSVYMIIFQVSNSFHEAKSSFKSHSRSAKVQILHLFWKVHYPLNKSRHWCLSTPSHATFSLLCGCLHVYSPQHLSNAWTDHHDIRHIMSPEAISTAYFINHSHYAVIPRVQSLKLLR